MILQSGIYISFTNISEGTAFLLEGVTCLVCKSLKKEGRAFQNIGKRNIIFPSVKSALLFWFLYFQL